MRYSNLFGIVAALCLIASCFLEWVYIDSIKTAINGINTAPTGFGKPGYLHIFFAVIAIILFALPQIAAKRVNVFISAINLAWAFKNILVVTQCQMGECPEKRVGIYAIVFFSVVMIIMSFLPKTPASGTDPLTTS
ncbi:hypothetical protein EXU57_05535 [Segetibacter sp. 3557_3]|uniref:hypothetical protein n=1 Tax=Segetibacter sp. 3557_3 TaxID=2547429 RepID=UPI0010591BA9|nr:hypothetical protein [Segetibacter sp. 3557_3]TDH27928.1 hypothetical protein EXU57_05535 [Segetibacter sp. 3557_3]